MRTHICSHPHTFLTSHPSQTLSNIMNLFTCSHTNVSVWMMLLNLSELVPRWGSFSNILSDFLRWMPIILANWIADEICSKSGCSKTSDLQVIRRAAVQEATNRPCFETSEHIVGKFLQVWYQIGVLLQISIKLAYPPKSEDLPSSCDWSLNLAHIARLACWDEHAHILHHANYQELTDKYSDRLEPMLWPEQSASFCDLKLKVTPKSFELFLAI